MRNPMKEIKCKMRFLVNSKKKQLLFRVEEVISPLFNVVNNCKSNRIIRFRLRKFINEIGQPCAECLWCREGIV